MSSTATKIQWTDATWNPTRGCSRVSEGCRNCYAERAAWRFAGENGPYEGLVEWRGRPSWTGRVELNEAALDEPLRWRKPRRVFVDSMSDLFHEGLPDVAVDRVFAVMAAARRHNFQVLTKRPERMRDYFLPREPSGLPRRKLVAAELATLAPGGPAGTIEWPLPNVWIGVSVEDQATADERLSLLFQAPAAKHFVSYEPALGPIDFTEYLHDSDCQERFDDVRACTCSEPREDHLDWVIVGGESGPGARPFNLAWARSVVKQCGAAGSACFVKQLGSNPCWSEDHEGEDALLVSGERFKDRSGCDPAEWPEELRVREFPS